MYDKKSNKNVSHKKTEVDHLFFQCFKKTESKYAHKIRLYVNIYEKNKTGLFENLFT